MKNQQLITEHLDFVKNFARKKAVLLNFDYDDTQDLISEAILGLVLASKHYKKNYSAKFFTYLYKTINRSINNERKKILFGTRTNFGINIYLHSIDEEDSEKNLQKLNLTYYNDFKSIDLDLILQKTRLNENERKVIEFSRDDISFTQIAKEMNLSKQRVHQLYSEALRKLKKKAK